MEVHADVLKMAETEEKRERIKWFHARRIFFCDQDALLSEGLSLAQQCQHKDARFLVSLFPGGALATKEEAAAVFLRHPEDARCLAWAAQCGAKPRYDLLNSAASGDDAWGETHFSIFLWAVGLEKDVLQGIERAVAQEEPDAMTRLAYWCLDGLDGKTDSARSKKLFRQAAAFGHPVAQCEYALKYCENGSAEQAAWLRRAAMQDRVFSQQHLVNQVKESLWLYDNGHSARMVYELGAGFANVDISYLRRGDQAAVARAVQLHSEWHAQAQKNVLCWLWLSQKLGVVKDVRVVIAQLIWRERAMWIENKRAAQTLMAAEASRERRRLMRVHSDILKLAKGDADKIERIHWFHARSLFFSHNGEEKSLAEGFALAKGCNHEDARFLVSLFPKGPPASRREAAEVFLGRCEEPRCQCWAAECGAEPHYELLKSAAESGSAWAQSSFAHLGQLASGHPMGDDKMVVWLKKAVAQGEPEAMTALAEHWWGEAVSMSGVEERTQNLLRAAAELGDPRAQRRFGMYCFELDSPGYWLWLRRSAIQQQDASMHSLVSFVNDTMSAFRQGGTGRFVFEIGLALVWNANWQSYISETRLAACAEAFRLYQKWCEEAKRGVMCWLWLSRDLKIVIKDVRLMIADLIWEERAAWSERNGRV